MGSQPAPSIVIRPLPAVVYLYPSALCALLCGLVSLLSDADAARVGMALGLGFTFFFFANLSILAFEYSRMTAITMVLSVVIMALLCALFPALIGLLEVLFVQPLYMNATFYFVWSAAFVVLIGLAMLRTYFDYWEINSNEIVHRRGILGDVERWPAPNVRFSKEIRDVLEYALFRSGRLVLLPTNEPRALVIDHVRNINRVEARMQELLSSLRVVDGDE
ncbi:MAG: hypothetical protein EXR76_09835 [Myxococcales bacterium]|nr:hypothetical protein [Myxococcales bacterium]